MQNKHVSMFDRVDLNKKKEILFGQPILKVKLKMNEYITYF